MKSAVPTHPKATVQDKMVVIEQNLEIIAEADWIIDLGPEGGEAGGRLVLQAPPREAARHGAGSHTGRVLAPFLSARTA